MGSEYFVGALNTENIHILLHEIGHSFGLDDFYDWTPTGQCCFIMKAGSATPDHRVRLLDVPGLVAPPQEPVRALSTCRRVGSGG